MRWLDRVRNYRIRKMCEKGVVCLIVQIRECKSGLITWKEWVGMIKRIYRSTKESERLMGRTREGWTGSIKEALD